MEKLNSGEGVIIIDKNQIYNGNTRKFYIGQVAEIKIGDEIELQHMEQGGEDWIKFGKVR